MAVRRPKRACDSSGQEQPQQSHQHPGGAVSAPPAPAALFSLLVNPSLFSSVQKIVSERHIKSGIKSTPAMQEIIACRVCLATTGKLFRIESYSLKQTFFDISGIQVSLGDGLPQHICYICYGLLQKAVEFRNKCHSTRSLLSSHPLTLDLINKINLLHGQPLIRTNILYVNVGEELLNEVDENELENYLNDKNMEINLVDKKVENSLIKKDFNNDFNYFNQHDNELNTENDFNDYKDESDDSTSVVCQQSNLKIESKEAADMEKKYEQFELKNKNIKGVKKTKSKQITSRNLDDEKIIQYFSKNKGADKHKKNFYEYVGAKYVEKTWKKELSEDENKLTVKANNNEIKTFNFNPSLNPIYNYLRDRYGYIDADREVAEKAFFDSDDQRKKRCIEIEDAHIPKYFRNYAANNAKEFGNKYNFEVVRFSKEEQRKNMRERMETERYKNAKYKCEDCYTGFKYEHKYVKHRTQHNPVLSGNYECDLCKLRFRNKIRLNNHSRKSHKFRYICKEKDCGKYFHDRVYCIHHHKAHNGGATYKCKYCPTVFRKHWYFYDHVREKHGTVFCAVCHAVLMPGGVAKHMQMQHKETFKCRSCKKVFNDSAARDKHMNTSPNGVCVPSDCPCTKCGTNFSVEDHLKEHIVSCRRRDQKGLRKVRSSAPKQRKICRVFVCERCGRTCANITHLRDHIRIHTGERPFQCPTCPKSFRLKVLLKYHIRTHTGEKPFKCPDCPKSYASPSILYKHRLVHTKLRPHLCTICYKSFTQNAILKTHIQTVHMKIPSPPRTRSGTRKLNVLKDIRIVSEENGRRATSNRRNVTEENEKSAMSNRRNVSEENGKGATSNKRNVTDENRRRATSNMKEHGKESRVKLRNDKRVDGFEEGNIKEDDEDEEVIEDFEEVDEDKLVMEDFGEQDEDKLVIEDFEAGNIEEDDEDFEEGNIEEDDEDEEVVEDFEEGNIEEDDEDEMEVEDFDKDDEDKLVVDDFKDGNFGEDDEDEMGVEYLEEWEEYGDEVIVKSC